MVLVSHLSETILTTNAKFHWKQNKTRKKNRPLCYYHRLTLNRLKFRDRVFKHLVIYQVGNVFILLGPIRFLFTVDEHGTASRWKELLENNVCGAQVGWLLRFDLPPAFLDAASGASVETLYFSSFPSKISFTSVAFNKVTFVAMLLCPNPNCTICFRSSSVASLRHKEGYFLYKDPLNIRRKFPTSDPIIYCSPSPSWKELGFWPYVRTAIFLFSLSRLPTVLREFQVILSISRLKRRCTSSDVFRFHSYHLQHFYGLNSFRVPHTNH